MTLLELAQEVQAVLNDEAHQVLVELARVGGSPSGARPKVLVYFNPVTGQMSTQGSRLGDAQAWLVKFRGYDDEPAGPPRAVAEAAIDELLGLATPDVLLALAQDLPLRASTLGALHRAMQSHHARLVR